MKGESKSLKYTNYNYHDCENTPKGQENICWEFFFKICPSF